MRQAQTMQVATACTEEQYHHLLGSLAFRVQPLCYYGDSLHLHDPRMLRVEHQGQLPTQ